MHEVIESSLIGLAASAVYCRTLCRTVYVGDSGELIAAAETLGIAHPPGYPLYILAAKLFSATLRAGNPALRANLFSSTCAGVGAAVSCAAFRTMGIGPATAAAAAPALAFGASLWSQATVARVYAPLTCALSISMYCLAHWDAEPAALGWLAGGLAATGIALAVHPVAVALLPAIVAAVALRRPSLLTDMHALKAVLWLSPGLSLYLWVPLRARWAPAVRWGDLRSSKDLFRYFFRAQYWKFRYVRNPVQALQVILFYLLRVAREYGAIGAAAIAIGICVMARRSLPLLAASMVLAIGNLIAMLLHGRREDIFYWPRYMMPAWVGLAFPLAVGWDWTIRQLPPTIQWPCALLLPIILLLRGFRKRDLSRHRIAGEYSLCLLNNLPAGSILIAHDDNVLFPLMYLKYVERVRPDVKLIDVAARERSEFSFNPRREPIYCTHRDPAFQFPPRGNTPGLKLVPEGLAYRIISTDTQYEARNLWPAAEPPGLDESQIAPDYLTRQLRANVFIMRAEWESGRDTEACRTWCQRAANAAPTSEVVRHNIGVILKREGFEQAAMEQFSAAAKIRSGDGVFRIDETG